MSRRTDIPNTSSSTPKSSQGRRNKKTVLPMKIATSGDKEEHNQRRKHELCEYGTSREIFSENFDGTTQLRNGQTPVDGNKGDLDEE
ncbi:BnaUnng02550D, partial [Brassica napus]